MKTCRECFHYTPCWKATSVAVRQNVENNEIVQYCEDFCDRERVLLLPIGIGEVVWMIDCEEIVEIKVVEITAGDAARYGASFVYSAIEVESDQGYYYFNQDDLGVLVHLAREAAEAALAMRNDKKAR